jgi:uncharacterized membrane protein
MSAPRDDREAGKGGPRWGDAQVEEIMGNLLRTGVMLSAAVVLIGGFLYLVRYGGEQPGYHLFHGEPQELSSVQGTLYFTLHGHRRGLIQVGLLLLIATPIARVIFSVYAFLRERDYLYLAITLVVLSVLAYSLLSTRI